MLDTLVSTLTLSNHCIDDCTSTIAFICSDIRFYKLITYKFNIDITDHLEGNLHHESYLIAILIMSG